MNTKQKDKMISMYLDYVNNFITLSGFAEYYGYDIDFARYVVNYGRILNNKE